jgi:hypothetical protein
VPPVPARRGRHWQRWGLKHAVDAEKASRMLDQLRGTMGMGNGSEASRLRIGTSAELKRLSGSRPKMGRGSGSADINGRPTHVSYPPVYRGALTPSVQLAKRGKPDPLSGAVQRVSPRSRPRASTGNGGAGKGRGRKRRLSCNGTDRGASVAPPERGPTSRGCDRTRPTRQTVNRGSVDHG